MFVGWFLLVVLVWLCFWGCSAVLHVLDARFCWVGFCSVFVSRVLQVLGDVLIITREF